jgi:hypothetical protein
MRMNRPSAIASGFWGGWNLCLATTRKCCKIGNKTPNPAPPHPPIGPKPRDYLESVDYVNHERCQSQEIACNQ